MAQTSIYAFNDYRAFLGAFQESKKDEPAGFTMSAFSAFCGFQSANYARLVVDGKRNLTNSSIHDIAKAMKMTFGETDYFEALVHRDQAVTDAERSFYARKLRELKKRAPKSTGRLSAARLLNHPYYPFILTALDRCEVEKASTKVARITGLKEVVIARFIEDLLKLELVEEVDGEFRLKYSHEIFHDVKSSSLRHKQFIGWQIDLSKRMLEKTYERGGRFYCHTFSVAKSDLPHYEERIRSLLSEFTCRSDETAADNVAQLNIQLFPAENMELQ